MPIYSFKETYDFEHYLKNFKLENASRDEPFELKNKEKTSNLKNAAQIVTPKEYYQMIQIDPHRSRHFKIDWSKQ